MPLFNVLGGELRFALRIQRQAGSGMDVAIPTGQNGLHTVCCQVTEELLNSPITRNDLITPVPHSIFWIILIGGVFAQTGMMQPKGIACPNSRGDP